MCRRMALGSCTGSGATRAHAAGWVVLGACQCLRAAARWQAAADGLGSEYLKPADDAFGRAVVNGTVTGLACVAVVGTFAVVRRAEQGSAGSAGRRRGGQQLRAGDVTRRLLEETKVVNRKCPEGLRSSMPLFSSTR